MLATHKEQTCFAGKSHLGRSSENTKFAYETEDCMSEPDQGPCDAYFPWWYYNVKTESCERFVYGGCGGNGNKYLEREECETTCKREGSSFTYSSRYTFKFMTAHEIKSKAHFKSCRCNGGGTFWKYTDYQPLRMPSPCLGDHDVTQQRRPFSCLLEKPQEHNIEGLFIASSLTSVTSRYAFVAPRHSAAPRARVSFERSVDSFFFSTTTKLCSSADLYPMRS